MFNRVFLEIFPFHRRSNTSLKQVNYTDRQNNSFGHSIYLVYVGCSKNLYRTILLITINLLSLTTSGCVHCLLCDVSPESFIMVKHLTKAISHPVDPLNPESFEQPVQLISFMCSHPVLACLSAISSHWTGQGS